jgi:uncharacterized iron-regulated protein
MRTIRRPALPLALLTSMLLSAPLRAGDAPSKELEATLRKLEKDIAAVRGLKFKKPVVAHVVPRPKEARKDIQGYYSTKDKALYLYDDLRGAYRQGVLIHEMVHALQDQHFGLDKLHAASFGSDAELAQAALVEGDATFTMIELLKKDQPRVTAMLDVDLAKARNLRHAFLYAQGARYVQALKKRGGWKAVDRRYLFAPRSSAEILHPEGLALIDLGPGKVRGELELIALLAGHRCTAAEAVQAAAGWRGDRVITDGPSRGWVIAFATPSQATRFQAALAKHHTAEEPGLKSFLAEPGARAWHTPGGAVRAILTRGVRVLEINAPNDSAYRKLLERLEGPLSLTIRSRDGKKLTFGELIDHLMKANVVCIGETHDSDLHHRVQLQIIKALFARDERLGVGMEMFQRPFQKEVDRFLRGGSEEDFLKATEYRQRWGYEWSLYRPIVEFCRRNGLPLAALNVSRELTRRLSQVGYAKLSADEKKQLGAIDFHVKEHRAYWLERLAKMHGRSKATLEEKERSYQVMTTWDEYMADSAARFQKERRLERLVLLAGSGHIERGFGIPARVVKRTGGKAVTVRIEVGGKGKKEKKERSEPVTDYVLVIE